MTLTDLSHRVIREEDAGNPMLHFLREYTKPVDEQEWGGAVALVELVAAFRVIHPRCLFPDRAMAMNLAAALKTLYAKALSEGSITKAKHLPNTPISKDISPQVKKPVAASASDSPKSIRRKCGIYLLALAECS